MCPKMRESKGDELATIVNAYFHQPYHLINQGVVYEFSIQGVLVYTNLDPSNMV